MMMLVETKKATRDRVRRDTSRSALDSLNRDDRQRQRQPECTQNRF